MLPDVKMLTTIADKYGDSVNSTKDAVAFFHDFMIHTRGRVIVDFLDQDNDDHIEKFTFDHDKGLLTIIQCESFVRIWL